MTDRYKATAAEIAERRARAVRLRFARQSESEIAQQLQVSVATGSRDLRAAQEDWAKRFGSRRDAAEEVGEAVALFELLEGAAVDELVRLESADGASTGARMQCLWAARAMRLARLDLLVTAGVIKPDESSTLQAAQLRMVLQAEGLLDPRRESSSDASVGDTSNEDVLNRWLQDDL